MMTSDFAKPGNDVNKTNIATIIDIFYTDYFQNMN
jgi:hypothetical protein